MSRNPISNFILRRNHTPPGASIQAKVAMGLLSGPSRDLLQTPFHADFMCRRRAAERLFNPVPSLRLTEPIRAGKIVDWAPAGKDC
jgi:hypothetical protein